MTLTEIMVTALGRLERGSDSQTIAKHRDNFIFYANQAILLICERWRPMKKESLTVTSSQINTANLTRVPVKIKKVTVTVDGVESEVSYEQTFDGSGIFEIDNGDATAATADVYYQYVPLAVTDSQDVPEIPLYTHDMIVNYLVACTRAGGDPATQSAASADFQLFNQQLRNVKPSNMWQSSSRKLKNYW